MFKNGGVIRQVFLRKVQRVRLMKKVRKLLAVVLAMVMSMSVAVPAFAAEVVPGAVDQQEAVAVKTTESDGSGVVLLVDWTHTIGPNWKTIAAGGDLTGHTVRIDVHSFNWGLHQVNVRFFHNGVEVAHIKEYDNVTKASGVASVTCPAGATEMQMQIVPRFWGVQDHWYQVTVTP